jgi:hypothetical protein
MKSSDSSRKRWLADRGFEPQYDDDRVLANEWMRIER